MRHEISKYYVVLSNKLYTCHNGFSVEAELKRMFFFPSQMCVTQVISWKAKMFQQHSLEKVAFVLELVNL